MSGEVELVIDAKAILGEGPSWDRNQGVLYWIDIEGEKLNIYNPEKDENRIITLPGMIGAAVPREAGGAVAAMQDGFYFIDTDNGVFEQIGDPESGMPENRFNDGKCDPKGRFWAGTMSLAGREGEGSLYCLEPNLSITKKLGGLGISNGLAWSPCWNWMYFIDTPTRKITRFKYDLDSGSIFEPVDIISIPEGDGNPDGMTIDEEGFLWIAHWGGGKISRWNPETGKMVSEIIIPALNVTSCTFGGKDLQDLYITTARTGMTDEELANYPLAGGVFKINIGVKGAPSYEFKG